MTPLYAIMDNPMIDPVMVMPFLHTPIQAGAQMQTSLLKIGGESSSCLLPEERKWMPKVS